MKTIKVIDLINGCYIGDENLPEIVKYNNNIYKKDKVCRGKQYFYISDETGSPLIEEVNYFVNLSDEVEIIEEEKDSFSGIRYFQDGNCYMSISSEPPKTQDIAIEKEIEKIKIHQEYTSKGKLHDYLYYQDNKYALSLPQKVLTDTLNELIDAVNELKREK